MTWKVNVPAKAHDSGIVLLASMKAVGLCLPEAHVAAAYSVVTNVVKIVLWPCLMLVHVCLQRLVLAAGPVGLMQAALDVALPYATQRKQFGKVGG
jgi:hypothetical protein